MWLGLDFSGYFPNWGPGVSNSPVWLAVLVQRNGKYTLRDLYPVQRLPGTGHPFVRLWQYLNLERYAAAAIDAPFSVPFGFIHGHHVDLLRKVQEIPCGKRPFPDSITFVTAVVGSPPPLSPPKPLRHCEAFWRTKGINVRSTLWAGPRGGAAMTAACLKLLANVRRPMWPFDHFVPEETVGFVAEAFPAAQLRYWGWPHQGYMGAKGSATRSAIVERLADVVSTDGHEQTLLRNDNALDAVFCALAALSVSTGKLAISPAEQAVEEGWIAVHDKSILNETARCQA